MDLSFVDFSEIPEVWKMLAACLNLRSLDAEGSGIESLDDMQPMEALLVLNLVDNDIEDLSAISSIGSCCKGLQRLDLRENPVAVEIGYREAVGRACPSLVEHDNQSKRTYVAKPRDFHCGVDPRGPDTVHAIDGLFQGESCSCLEGTPCTDAATCLDWANRDKVAAHVRASFHLPQGQWSMGFNFRS
eukprot:gb/GFBE01078664.1/.p1 GENE.gb/GFBE01078664.1/~~gb/GFBE01078664.1/.p1  ORF type:complete len:188 (+),score=36.66 gb/GFBE01078664.1/:1-564(+)